MAFVLICLVSLAQEGSGKEEQLRRSHARPPGCRGGMPGDPAFAGSQALRAQETDDTDPSPICIPPVRACKPTTPPRGAAAAPGPT